MNEYKTEIIRGKVYKHKHSKIEGVAMSVSFYLYGCVRVAILPKDSKDNIWLHFDEAELVSVTTRKTGGPRPDAPQERQ